MSDYLQAIVKTAVAKGVVDAQTTVIGLMNYDGLAQTVHELHQAFPAHFKHAFAVKANPVVPVLSQLRALGMQAEVASPGELVLAMAAGFLPHEIIFDSPSKTWADLETCVQRGVGINVDNETELLRIDVLKQKYPDSRSIIGFRINPQVGKGGIESTSTAGATTKFGYALHDPGNFDHLVDLYLKRPWLTSIQMHAGSQGCPLELMATCIWHIVDLAEKINTAAGYQQVTKLDIGGGLPVNFDSDLVTPTFFEYAALLQQRVPQLFTGHYAVETEFGRAICAKNGVMLTKVEYAKFSGGRQIAQTHAGAQVATRTTYVPDVWKLRVAAFDANGRRKLIDDEQYETDIAGPCCFAGDLVAKNVLMPKLNDGDFIAVLDTGAYYFSSHFDYNSLPTSAIYSVYQLDNEIHFHCIREAGTLDEIIHRMGGHPQVRNHHSTPQWVPPNRDSAYV